MDALWRRQGPEGVCPAESKMLLPPGGMDVYLGPGERRFQLTGRSGSTCVIHPFKDPRFVWHPRLIIFQDGPVSC